MSDESPSPQEAPDGIRPMPVYVAIGWTIGTLLIQAVLESSLLGARTATRDDLAKLFACQLGAYLFGIFLILRVHAPQAKIRDFLALRPTHFALYPLALLLGAVIQIPSEAIARAIVRRHPIETKDLLLGIHDDSLSRKILFGVIVVVLGPIIEEVFFRGALWKPLERGYASMRSLAILFTALLFATVHLSWHFFIPYWILGLCMGFLRQASGSLIPSLLFHGTFNAVTLYSTLFPQPDEGDPLAPLPAWLVAAGFAGSALLLASIHFVSRRTAATARALELDQQ
jgi:membrane protease YdiL (CAAX protease family)